MIFTTILMVAALEAPQADMGRTSVVRLAPAGDRYVLQMEVRENGALIGSPAVQLVEGEAANISVAGYRIELTAAPSPAARYAPEAVDDVFVSSRVMSSGETGWQHGTVAIEPGNEGAIEFDVSATGEASSTLSVSYRLTGFLN